ncbi:hypothetical protein BDR07DRAFT_1402663 [Suillus spraguei]|nr:hypothetical protein BDR07DRAFT_1402663 [Suillus spraguei]
MQHILLARSRRRHGGLCQLVWVFSELEWVSRDRLLGCLICFLISTLVDRWA